MSEEQNDSQRAINALNNILMSAINSEPAKMLPQVRAMAPATITTPAMFLHAIISGPQEFRDIMMNIDPITLLTAIIQMNSMVYGLDHQQAREIHNHVIESNEFIPSHHSIIGSVIGAFNLTGGHIDNSKTLETLNNLYMLGSAMLQAKRNAQAQKTTDAPASGEENAV